jgi:DNA helicase II / ATP-dependent DNA helicase PcrA
MSSAKKNTSSPRIDPDERQQAAIGHLHGPMLVVAGAGTGKTTVLTRRIAQLIRDGHASPSEVLALTYTDNAAKEMGERVKAELKGTDSQRLQTFTFHAYCNNLLIRNGREFGVLLDQDLWIFLRRRIAELDLKYFIRAANVSKFLDDLIEFTRRCQDELVGPEQYENYVRRLEQGELPLPRVTKSKEAGEMSDEEILGRCREIASVYAKVEGLLQEKNLGTFGHMITRAHDLLQSDPELLQRERANARFVLVDEFQDANFAQVKILNLLAGAERNVFAVGDPDQAIYRFRGASSAAFGLFQRHFPDAKVVVLEKNRRSVTSILRCGFALIDKNPPVFGAGGTSSVDYRRLPLRSARDEQGSEQGKAPDPRKVQVVLLAGRDNELEAADIAATITQLKRTSRCRWRDFAVIYRQHTHRDEVADELARRDIPFAIENMDVMDTPEVRDLFACLRSIVRPDDGASMLRVAALPQFSVKAEDFRAAMRESARQRGVSPVKLSEALQKKEGGPAVLQALQEAREEIGARALTASGALKAIIRRFGLQAGAPNIKAVSKFVDDWEEKPLTETRGVNEFLDYLDYFREAKGAAICLNSENEDAVRLMTAHTAKGLEFEHVFIVRANPPSFPQPYRESLIEFPKELRDADSFSDEDPKKLNDEEERRLFYVAMTRARDTLTIYAKQGTGKADKTPAGLLRDLLKDKTLVPWLMQRPATGFQTDMFGAAAAPRSAFVSRTSEWLALPPEGDLHLRLSATAIEMYKTCPLQFKLARDWRIPDEVSGALHYGAAIHTVLLAYFDSVRGSRRLSDEETIRLFRETLANSGIEDPYQHNLYEEQGVKQLSDFLKAHRNTTPESVLQTEASFESKVGESILLGRIDRVDDLGDGRVTVVDYKTGKPKTQEDADESLQLSIYALAAQEKWGYRVDRLAFYNLDGNHAVFTSRNSAQLEEAKAVVRDVADRIAEGCFEPNKGFHCRFCGYRDVCPKTERVTRLVTSIAKAGSSN